MATITIRNTTSELITMLERDEIDVAFVQDWHGDMGLCVKHLFDEPYMAVLPESHPMAKQSWVSFSMLVRGRMVVPQDPYDIRVAFR